MSTHPPLTPVGSALAGALGAVFSNALVYPLDTAKTRLQALPPSSYESPPPSPLLQASKISSKSLKSLPNALARRLRKFQLLQLLLHIIHKEGIAGAFSGFSANMINTFSQQFAYFFFHTLLRTRLLARLNRKSLSTSFELLLGALAGALAQIFTIPVQVIATRQQLWLPPLSSSSSSSSPTKARFPTLLETAQEIVAEDGPTGLWTGLKPGLVLTVNPAITYGVFERLKSWKLGDAEREGGKLSVGEAFWLGVGSKTLATVVTYPYIFAKVRLQARADDGPEPTSSTTGPAYAAVAAEPPCESSETAIVAAGPDGNEKVPAPHHKRHKHLGALELLQKVYKTEGFAGWYRGLGAQITKAVLCQGILFVSKDQFEGYAYLIMLFLSRLQGQVKQKMV